MFWVPKTNLNLEKRQEDLVVEAGMPVGATTSHYVGRPLNYKQLAWLAILSGLTLLILLGRTFSLEIVNGQQYLNQASRNSYRAIVLPAPRGLIYDAYGQALISNYPEFVLALIPSDLPVEAEARKKLFAEVTQFINLPPEELENTWQSLSAPRRRQLDPVIIDWPLSYLDGLKLHLAARQWSGVNVVTIPRRRLAAAAGEASSWSHVLGYVGRVTEDDLKKSNQNYLSQDVIGKNGLELVYESVLRGINGRRQVEINALGEEQLRFKETAPIAGRSIWLTIDSQLQNVAEAALRQQLERAGASRGGVVVMDANTGGLLALVSLPSFDSDAVNRGLKGDQYSQLLNDPDKPLFNRIVQGTYPSGSTIKMVYATAALSDGLIDASTSFLSTGGISIGQWFFPDWKAGGHGATNVRKALAESVNTFFYTIGGGYGDFKGLGIERLGFYAKLFGLGRTTGIDLPGEAAGFFPDEAWKEKTKNEPWYIGDTYHAAIGQGDVLVTPLQVAQYTAAIANGGLIYKPHVVGEIVGESGGRQDISPEVVAKDLVPSADLKIVREGLRQTVTDGSGRYLADLQIPVAGKTGTAEVGGDFKPHAWFSGFAPYERPQIVVTVLLENAGEGSTFAVPVAKEIFRWWGENRLEN